MKKLFTFLASVFIGTFILAGIISMPAHAEETWVAPEWTDTTTGSFRWEIPSDVSNYDCIVFRFYVDGDPNKCIWADDYRPNESYSSSDVDNGYFYGRCTESWNVYGSGSYVIVVEAMNIDDHGNWSEVLKTSAGSSAFAYTYPSAKLATPTGLTWVDKSAEYASWSGSYPQFAYATCNTVSGACNYIFRLYKDDEEVYNVRRGWSLAYGFSEDCNLMNLSDRIGDNDSHVYTFTVQAVPNDITAYRMSDESPRSPVLTLSDSTIQSQNTLISMTSDVDSSNVDDKIEEIKSLSNLDTAVRTSGAALEALDTIEEVFKSKNNITENAPTSQISEIDASGIEVTGAALNVAAGTTLGLNIGTPASYPSIDANAYKNAFVFDMGIQASDGTDFSQELDIPVTIKLPIPAGFNLWNMKMLHFRADGSFEEIPFRLDGDFIYISVYHFSTFAFAISNETDSAESLPPIIAPYRTKLLITDENGVSDNIPVDLAYTHQGEAATARANAVAGEGAFCISSYNIHVYDKANYSRKTGSLVFGLRSDMIVKNRTYFAVMIDNGGNAILLNDSDSADNTLTFNIDIEGYAIFIYFVDGPAPSASALAVTPSTPAGNTYIVQPGDTLGQIADKLGITAVELASINEIKNLNLIYPGQTIRY